MTAAAEARRLLAEGEGLLGEERLDEALDCFFDALALDPALAEAHNNVGVVFERRGNLRDATECFRKAIALQPALAEAHVNLGGALRREGDAQGAIACFREALRHRPGHGAATKHLASTLLESGQREEAIECLEALVAREAGDVEARWRLTFARLPAVCADQAEVERSRAAYAGDLERLCALLDAQQDLGAAQIEALVGASQPFHLAYQARDDVELQRRYGTLVCGLMARWFAARGLRYAPPPPAKGRRLRVGFVGAQFRDHSVWHAITRGFATRLDRRRFELIGYHLDARADDETARAQRTFEGFATGHRTLQEWVALLLHDRPDALVYPELGMDPMSIRLAALRLAPLQAAAWGHPATSGLPTIDWFLSGELLEPANGERHYTERLARLPGLGCCVERIAAASKPARRESSGVPDDRKPLFVSCQSAYKYQPQHDEVFPRIAAVAGECRFAFVEDPVAPLAARLRARIEGAFARHGLDPDASCTFIPWQAKDRFAALLRASNVYLDTIGFSGFNTALAALEAGLPIVTIDAPLMRGRLAAGILRRIGVEDTIADSVDAYVALAARLAAEPVWRRSLAERATRGLPTIYADERPVRALEDLLAGTL